MSIAAPESLELHGDHLAAALRSGFHRVLSAQETLNRINVFPVADGDTGTNLSLSLGAALHTLVAPGSRHVGSVLVSLADALLDGARGNSGAIIAQFFQGMSDAAQDTGRFTTATFAAAIAAGNEYARDALEDPREGTILSVIAAYADSLRAQLEQDAGVGIRQAMQSALSATDKALVRTEEQLDVLRKAGVVDAGAKGFAELVAGMTDYIVNGRITERPVIADQFVVEETEAVIQEADLQFRYCTECMITGSNIDRRKLRERMSALGNSLVIAGTKTKTRLHIHVNDPEAVFTLARSFGDLSSEKADDMKKQHGSAHGSTARFAVITDSAADIADEDLETHDIHMVPMRIQFGDRGYLDKVSMTPDAFFAELESAAVHPTTSQPSPGDFRRQYQFLASHFPDVISVSLTPKVSGTYQAAVSAAERIDAAGKVHVVNSLNASLGQGQIAVFAAECAAAGLDAATTLRALAQVIPRTMTFGLIRDLRYAVRGGRVPASKKLLADILRVTPVLQTDPEGRVTARSILPGRRSLLPKFARFIARRCSQDVSVRVSIGHALCRDDADELRRLLETRLPNAVRFSTTELGPAIGVHGGRGALVVAVQEYRPPADFC